MNELNNAHECAKLKQMLRVPTELELMNDPGNCMNQQQKITEISIARMLDSEIPFGNITSLY